MAEKTIEVSKGILDRNDRIAAELRDVYAKHGICCVNLLSGPGAGKTTTIIATIEALKDRYNAEKSREMFAIIQSHHNPTNSIERAIRIWKGGIGYSIRKTQNYVNRVLERMGL